MTLLIYISKFWYRWTVYAAVEFLLGGVGLQIFVPCFSSVWSIGVIDILVMLKLEKSQDVSSSLKVHDADITSDSDCVWGVKGGRIVSLLV